jgi:hypothetical protein
MPSPSSTGEPTAVLQDEPVIEPLVDLEPPPTGMLPLAIAKLYRLELVEPIEPLRRNSFTPLLEGTDGALNEPSSPTESNNYTMEQLLADVEVVFPAVVEELIVFETLTESFATL